MTLLLPLTLGLCALPVSAALAVVYRYSDYVDCYPLMTKTAHDAHGALLDF